jgi:excisionase family DNA binding protein
MKNGSVVADADDLLTTGDVARLANLSTDTIRYYERHNRLPAVKTVSGQRLFRRAVVARFLQAREDKAHQ